MVGLLTTHSGAANSRRARERSRVAAHIARAEKHARERAPALDALRSLVRRLLLDALGEYREHGVFPQNRHREINTPVFVDEAGTRCAVGHLLALSGEGALVAKISAERNLATVHELADEPALAQWLDAVGLSLHEAAVIQPSYSPACSTATQCFCDPYNAYWYSGAPDGGVANAVLDCTMTSANTARIDQIYGTTAGHAVGDSIRIGSYRGGPGPRVLVPVLSNGSQPVDRSFADAGEVLFLGIGVSDDGAATCNGYGLNVQPVLVRARASSVISALTSSNCAQTLAAAEPSATRQRCNGDCSCTVPAGRATSEAPAATLSVLLSLVTALTVRRAQKRRVARAPKP